MTEFELKQIFDTNGHYDIARAVKDRECLQFLLFVNAYGYNIIYECYGPKCQKFKIKVTTAVIE